MHEAVTPSQQLFEHYQRRIEAIDPIVSRGEVLDIVGMVMESRGPMVSIGDLCFVHPNADNQPGRAEVVGFRNNRVLLMPLHEMTGYHPGSRVIASNEKLSLSLGNQLLGRVLNGLGETIDGKGATMAQERRSIYQDSPHPLRRKPISEPLATGIKAIDAFITIGKGQRMGIFAGSGVGKSVLLGMIARNTSADVNVIGLIGERGREVREFIERDLGEEGLRRSVLVVATSDEPPLVRVKAALVATTIAEYFRDQGKAVLLMIDSITRVAMSQREIGLAIGEPPTTKGYTPSTYSLLPKLLERAGNTEIGSITGLYTVLVEGDDLNDPVADMARSILDGHIVLSRDLANMGHYPAIDPLQSVSRVMPQIVSPEHLHVSKRILKLLATYKEAEDLINIGAYVKGSNPEIDEALKYVRQIKAFLQQNVEESTQFEQVQVQMKNIISG